MIQMLPAALALSTALAGVVAVVLQLRGRHVSAAWCNLLTPASLGTVALLSLLAPDPRPNPGALTLLGALIVWVLLLVAGARRPRPPPALFWPAWVIHLGLSAGLAWLALRFRIF